MFSNISTVSGSNVYSVEKPPGKVFSLKVPRSLCVLEIVCVRYTENLLVNRHAFHTISQQSIADETSSAYTLLILVLI